MRDYGTVTHEGKEYIIDNQATLSNRIFMGSWFGALDGEAYTSEWLADAHDGDGNKNQVYWQFDAVRGDEPWDDSNWPWDDSHIAFVREC